MIQKFIKKIWSSNKYRKIFFILIVLWVSYLCFSIWADCFADTWVISAETKMKNFAEIMSEVIKCAYVILWPLLFICGISLDNSLVYGTWLHLDAPLWSFWNIMKNIANFMLWFFVLYSILRNILSSVWLWWDKKWTPIEVIKKTLIAWILIQMSRFLTAAVIDLSTVLTYAVWWLPMTVLRWNPQYTNRPIMTLNINAWTNTNGMNYNIYYTYWEHKVSECLIADNLPVSWSYIVWPQYAYIWNSYNDTGFYTDTWYCTVGWRPYKYNHVLSWDGWIYPDIYTITETWELKNKVYNNIEFIPTSWWALDSALSNCQIIPVNELRLSDTCRNWHYWPLSLTWNDEFFIWQSEWGSLLYTVDNLIEESKWFVWPLITIYSSLIDVQSFVDLSSWSSYVENFVSILIKFIFLFLLIAPIIGLAVILIVRIWTLWILIATIPIVIVFKVFEIKVLDKINVFDLWNAVKLIFAPVIITLAISISLIFINAISEININGIQREDVFDSLWIDTKDNRTYSILWLVDIELNTTLISKWKDDFAYIITMLCSIAIIWFFMVAALRLCGQIWSKVWDFIGKNTMTLLWDVPIIPIWWWVWFNAIKEVPQRKVNDVIWTLRNTSEENLTNAFPWLTYNNREQYLENKKNETKETVERLIHDIQGGTPIVYENLSKKDQEALVTYFGGDTNISERITKLNNYYSNNSNNKYRSLRDAWEKAKTSVDALKFTQEQLNTAVQSDPNRKKRAEWMIWGAVHTSDGVFIVDIIAWTENNPQYEIIRRDEYETRHFGVPVQSISQDDFNSWKEKDETKYNKMNEYITKLSKEFDSYQSLSTKDKEQWNDNEKAQNKNWDELFNDDLLKVLNQLSDNKFEKKWEDN